MVKNNSLTILNSVFLQQRKTMKKIIEAAWEDRSLLKELKTQEVIREIINQIDLGQLRVAEPSPSGWQVKEWVKKAAAVERIYSKDSDEYRYVEAQKDGVVESTELQGLTGGDYKDSAYLQKLAENVKNAEEKAAVPPVYQDAILRKANQGATSTADQAESSANAGTTGTTTSKKSEPVTTGAGYIDQNGLWVPYGIGA